MTTTSITSLMCISPAEDVKQYDAKLLSHLCYAGNVEVPIHSPSASGCGHHHNHKPDPNAAGPSSAGGDPAGPNGHYGRATLVICPLVAVIQWRQEIARYIAANALKVNSQH